MIQFQVSSSCFSYKMFSKKIYASKHFIYISSNLTHLINNIFFFLHIFLNVYDFQTQIKKKSYIEMCGWTEMEKENINMREEAIQHNNEFIDQKFHLLNSKHCDLRIMDDVLRRNGDKSLGTG